MEATNETKNETPEQTTSVEKGNRKGEFNERRNKRQPNQSQTVQNSTFADLFSKFLFSIPIFHSFILLFILYN